MEPLYRPRRRRATLAARRGRSEGLYAAGAGRRRDESYVIAIPPPNVTGEPPHGARAQRLAPGRARPLAPDAGLRHACGSRATTTPASRRRTWSRSSSSPRGRHGRSSAARRSSSGRGRGSSRPARTIMGQLRRLGASLDYCARALHDGRRLRRRGDAFFVHLWERGLDLPRTTGSSTGARSTRRRSPTSRSCTRTWTTRSRTRATRSPTATGRDRRSPRSDRRRSSPTSPSPCTRTTSATATRSAARSIVPYVERRVPVIADERVEPDFGIGRAEDHPGHDPARLRDRTRPRAAGARPVIGLDGRMNDAAGDARGPRRRTRRTSACSPGCRSAASSRSASTTGTRSGTASAATRRIEPLISLAVVVPDGGARARRRSRRCGSGASSYHPESQHRFAISLARERARLVHLAPALVGPSAADLVLPRRPRHGRVARSPTACAECGSRELVDATRTCSTRGSPRRSGRSRRSAGRSDAASSSAYYPGDVHSTAREIIRLWENRMIFAGLELLGEVPFTDVIIHSTVLAPDGRRMSKSLGTGIDPIETDRRARRGRDPLRAAQDLVHPGRAVLVRRDRGGPQARQQALERLAADPPERASGSTPALDPDALEERWILARIDAARAEIEERWSAVRLRGARRARSTTSPSTTSATGTRRRSSRGSTTATRTRARPRWPRSSGCWRSSTR